MALGETIPGMSWAHRRNENSVYVVKLADPRVSANRSRRRKYYIATRTKGNYLAGYI